MFTTRQTRNSPTNQSNNRSNSQSRNCLIDRPNKRPIDQSSSTSNYQTNNHSDEHSPSVRRPRRRLIKQSTIESDNQSICQTNNRSINPPCHWRRHSILDRKWTASYYQPINQTISQTIDQSINQSISLQSLNESIMSNLQIWPWDFDAQMNSINQSINHTIHQSINQPVNSSYVSVNQFHSSGHVFASGAMNGSVHVYDFTSMLEADQSINQSIDQTITRSRNQSNNQINNQSNDQSIKVEPMCVIQGHKARLYRTDSLQWHLANQTNLMASSKHSNKICIYDVCASNPSTPVSTLSLSNQSVSQSINQSIDSVNVVDFTQISDYPNLISVLTNRGTVMFVDTRSMRLINQSMNQSNNTSINQSRGVAIMACPFTPTIISISHSISQSNNQTTAQVWDWRSARPLMTHNLSINQSNKQSNSPVCHASINQSAADQFLVQRLDGSVDYFEVTNHSVNQLHNQSITQPISKSINVDDSLSFDQFRHHPRKSAIFVPFFDRARASSLFSDCSTICYATSDSQVKIACLYDRSDSPSIDHSIDQTICQSEEELDDWLVDDEDGQPNTQSIIQTEYDLRQSLITDFVDDDIENSDVESISQANDQSINQLDSRLNNQSISQSISRYGVRHCGTLSFPGPVLSLAAHPTEPFIVAGMTGNRLKLIGTQRQD